MGSNKRLKNKSAPARVIVQFCLRLIGMNQGLIQYHDFGAGGACLNGGACVFLQRADEKRLFQEI